MTLCGVGNEPGVTAMTMKAILTASVITVALAGTAQAIDVAALVGGDTIAIIDTTAKKATKRMKVSGVAGPLLGIDVRPADGMLYALAADGTLYTIGMDGKATAKSKLETMLPAGVVATVDFNPVADRLRVIGSDGTSLRVNVDDGKVVKDGSLKFADGDAGKGMTPKVVAGAYTNSVKGTRKQRCSTSTPAPARWSSRRRRTMASSIPWGRWEPRSTPSPSTSGPTAPRTKPGP